jgi:hypothetical protein
VNEPAAAEAVAVVREFCCCCLVMMVQSLSHYCAACALLLLYAVPDQLRWYRKASKQQHSLSPLAKGNVYMRTIEVRQ